METLKNWRSKNRVSQKRLAELIGTTDATVCKYENGNLQMSSEVAKRIEAATNGEVTAAELLGLTTSGVRETPREFEHASTLHVELDEKDLNDAAKFGLNAEAIARKAVEEKVKAARLKAWVSDNKSAFDAHAKDVEENGLWSDGLRQF